jgi:hypothetical protein
MQVTGCGRVKMYALEHGIIDISQAARQIIIRIKVKDLISGRGRHRECQIPGFYRTNGKTAVLVRLYNSIPVFVPVVEECEVEIISGGRGRRGRLRYHRQRKQNAKNYVTQALHSNPPAILRAKLQKLFHICKFSVGKIVGKPIRAYFCLDFGYKGVKNAFIFAYVQKM